MYREVRARFRQAQRDGWFLPGATTTKYPLRTTGVSLEGETAFSPSSAGYREAAVLYLIGIQAASSQHLKVLITKRSTNITAHPDLIGEYCLPGGMRDNATDRTLLQTALRETKEEVGIGSEFVEVVSSSLPPFLSGWLQTIAVTAVVGLLKCDIDELELKENRDEVETTMWIPLHHFIVGDYHKDMKGYWRGVPSSINSFHLPPSRPSEPPCIVWGLTAGICVTISSIALGELPHYPSNTHAISKIDRTHVYTTEFAHTSQLHRTPSKL